MRSNSFSIKINKDITKIKDSLFLGLDFRTALFMCASLLSGAYTFFNTADSFDSINPRIMVTSAVAAPFAVIAFFKYQGLTAGQCIKELIQSCNLPQFLTLTIENDFYDDFTHLSNKRIKEALRNDKVLSKKAKRSEKLQRKIQKAAENSTSDTDK